MGLTTPTCGGDDDDTTGDTAGDTTGTGDSQGADCDNVAGTQPCNCLTTVVAVGKQTCTDEGWSACECPGACEERTAIYQWCPNITYVRSLSPTNTDDAACERSIPFDLCMCGKTDASLETQLSCIEETETTTGGVDE